MHITCPIAQQAACMYPQQSKCKQGACMYCNTLSHLQVSDSWVGVDCYNTRANGGSILCSIVRFSLSMHVERT